MASLPGLMTNTRFVTPAATAYLLTDNLTRMLIYSGLIAVASALGGYWLARWLGRDVRECRTLAIEVGMQNSGLAVALAVKYFSASAALPGALFSIWHNLSGSFLAGYWHRRAEGVAS